MVSKSSRSNQIAVENSFHKMRHSDSYKLHQIRLLADSGNLMWLENSVTFPHDPGILQLNRSIPLNRRAICRHGL